MLCKKLKFAKYYRLYIEFCTFTYFKYLKIKEIRSMPNTNHRITLADEKDEYGLPRDKMTFSYSEKDWKLIKHGGSTMSSILEAEGGSGVRHSGYGTYGGRMPSGEQLSRFRR
jgi:hypothetical protein